MTRITTDYVSMPSVKRIIVCGIALITAVYCLLEHVRLDFLMKALYVKKKKKKKKKKSQSSNKCIIDQITLSIHSL